MTYPAIFAGGMNSTMSNAPFNILAYGARFRYVFDPDAPRPTPVPDNGRVWVRIDVNTIAEWDSKNAATNWAGQQICCFSADADEQLGNAAPQLSTEVLLVD